MTSTADALMATRQQLKARVAELEAENASLLEQVCHWEHAWQVEVEESDVARAWSAAWKRAAKTTRHDNEFMCGLVNAVANAALEVRWKLDIARQSRARLVRAYHGAIRGRRWVKLWQHAARWYNNEYVKNTNQIVALMVENTRLRNALEKLRWRGIHDEWCATKLDGGNAACDCGKMATNAIIDGALGKGE